MAEGRQPHEIDDAENVSYVEDAEQQETEMVEVNPNLDDLLDNHTLDSYDTLLNAELMLPHGDQMINGRVVKRAKDSKRCPIG